jgi:NADH-quinone oxidoreductase subunit G
MAKITVDGKLIDAKPGQMVLQACNDAGMNLPQYCYHPGMSIPASCRICLVEVEGIPKLVPSCQTPVRDGMVIHSNSSKAIANQKQVMEYLLINHPLDCPVCDQAGECYLQDYSYQYGRSQSRFEEDKAKKPKKDVGLHVLLYNDRCIMCTRCVRFTREIAGTSELYVDGRGYREEIDIFPGKPLNNKLSGNVVDLCPVGALLDKSFLFKQRVWLLKEVPSISPVDAGGENIWLDYSEGQVWRIRPRYNAAVNTWWISDDTRYAYQILTDSKRIKTPRKLQYGAPIETTYSVALDAAKTGLVDLVKANGPGSVYAVLSPMMPTEEAYLLGKAIRTLDPQAVLALGPVPTTGQNEVFKNSITGKQTFEIQAEKVPNARGVRRVLEMLAGPQASIEQLTGSAGNGVGHEGGSDAVGRLKGGWIVGGYFSSWSTNLNFPRGFKVVQDILPGKLADSADVLLPGALWAEKDGSFENYVGKVQPFAAAVPPPEGVRREGDTYLNLLSRRELYNAESIRREMGGELASVKLESTPATAPAFEFAEL